MPIYKKSFKQSSVYFHQRIKMSEELKQEILANEESENSIDDEDEDDLSEESSQPMALPVEIELNDRYLELLSDPLLYQANQCIISDRDGVISASKTRQKLCSFFDSLKGGFIVFTGARIRSLVFLQSLWLAGAENLSQEYWWVNRNAIRRLLYVTMVAEAYHQRQHGDLKKEQIPPHLIFLYDYIDRECTDETFEEMHTDYLTLVNECEGWVT